jgi:hypothetical protein
MPCTGPTRALKIRSPAARNSQLCAHDTSTEKIRRDSRPDLSNTGGNPSGYSCRGPIS